jgi:hypothetical protein
MVIHILVAFWKLPICHRISIIYKHLILLLHAFIQYKAMLHKFDSVFAHINKHHAGEVQTDFRKPTSHV